MAFEMRNGEAISSQPLAKVRKRGDSTPLATTKRFYYCHCEARSAEAISSLDSFASGSSDNCFVLQVALVIGCRFPERRGEKESFPPGQAPPRKADAGNQAHIRG